LLTEEEKERSMLSEFDYLDEDLIDWFSGGFIWTLI
jgi:hypothetical protein